MKRFFVFVSILTVLVFNAVAQEGSLAKVKQNYRNILVASAENDSLMEGLLQIEKEKQASDQMVIELFQMLPVSQERVNDLATQMATDGSWPDINYKDTLRSGWDPKNHAERILELAKAYANPKAKTYKSPRVESLIHRALEYWFKTKPVCLNWWYNEVGIPRTMGEAFILIEDILTPEEKAEAIILMEHAKFGMTGQNKVWLAGNVLMRALLQNNEALVKEARDIIASEIVTGQEEGIKSDWSYHQHGPVQQFGNYGLAFIFVMSQYYGIFNDTPFAFDQNQEDILVKLINEGFRWTIWNRKMDVSSLGRQFFHSAQLHKGYILAFSAQVFGIGNFPLKGNNFVGHKHFYDSDYTIHRTEGWMASLKMSSSRIIGSELVNEDNLKGKYLGDGATFFYVSGNEYDNVYPFWQWDRIPGTTSYETPGYEPSTNYVERWESNNTSSLVGGLTVGNIGLSAMQFERDGLKANKAYLMTDEYVLCLGNGISSDSAAVVRTTIDQKNKKGDIWILSSGKWYRLAENWTMRISDIRLFHDKVGYVVLSKDSCEIRTEERDGSWHSFMGMYTPAVESGKVVEVALNHGVSPKNAQYQYVVLPNCSQNEVKKFNAKDIEIIKNDPEAQVISAKAAGKGTWVVAYKDVSIKIEGKTIQFVPGIYYLEKGAVLNEHRF